MEGPSSMSPKYAPNRQRGLYTSFIQLTPACGLLLSLIVIIGLRSFLQDSAFAEWGWRIPFLLSVVLLGISVWIRVQLNESPAFKKIKEEGRQSRAPLFEAFGTWTNAKIALIALFGGAAGSAVVWQTAQLYTLFFLTRTLAVDANTANLLVGSMLLIAIPLFIFFGWLSDRIGRKPIIMAGASWRRPPTFPCSRLFHDTRIPI